MTEEFVLDVRVTDDGWARIGTTNYPALAKMSEEQILNLMACTVISLNTLRERWALLQTVPPQKV